MITAKDPKEIADFFHAYIAQSPEGTWKLYEKKPVNLGGGWIQVGGKEIDIPSSLINYNGKWGESLRGPIPLHTSQLIMIMKKYIPSTLWQKIVEAALAEYAHDSSIELKDLREDLLYLCKK